MRKKYGIQLRGLGRALGKSGLGVLRPKPTGKGGKPLKPKPIRPGKMGGGMMKRPMMKKGGAAKGAKPVTDPKVLEAIKLKKPPKGTKRLGKKDGGKAKKFPDLTGDGKVTRADVLKGRGVFREGGRANTRRMNRLEELGRVDSEKAYSRKGKRNLKSEKRRIVRELNK